MIQKFKTLMKTNYKKGLAFFAIYLVVKWTLILTLGSYLHAKGYTEYFITYWYVIVLVLGVCLYVFYLHNKRKKASKSSNAKASEDK